MVNFTATPETAAELDRVLNLNEVRHAYQDHPPGGSEDLQQVVGLSGRLTP